MEGSLSESVQQLVRPGKCVDVYYPDPETAHKQCFRTTQNTRYAQQFSNLSGGSSVFTIPPNNGIQDIVVSMTLPAQGVNGLDGTLLAVPRGWAYALIKQISFRYGGSSQYFMSGQQVLQAALSMAAETGSQSAILSLGGDALAGATQFGSVSNSGYVWLPLPHCVPTAEGKLAPIPSDLLTQQIQITVELYPLSKIFSLGTSAVLSSVPTQLASASFTVQQVIFENQGDALARRVDMSSHALSYPITFRQQEVTIPVASGTSITPSTAGKQSVTLTGFRSGEVKALHCWLTADSDTPTPAPNTVQNPFAWYPLRDSLMTYAGEVYARFDGNSGQLWNLVNGRVPSQVSDVRVVAGTTPTITTTGADGWTILPFSQSYDDTTAHSMYMAGKPITNGIINLEFTIPPYAPVSSYTLHVSYLYNGVLTFSQGTCDYVF